ncbi:MAG: polysaccharide pyruvyl transferase family protein [Clostridium sp.]|nr:polysaccharide pyruvyl transferase family protein [Clostridium sp.]
MNIILYANGTSENHGCEAITLSTREILKGLYDTLYCTTTNLSYEKELPKDSKWIEYSYFCKPTLFNRIISKFERTVFRRNLFAESKPWLEPVYAAFKECKIALSVGGDNYCNNSYEWLYMCHDEAIKKGLKTVLWGCSVDERCLSDEKMKSDLLRFDVICARESLTYDILRSFHKDVRLFPDPAFVLECDDSNLKLENNKQFVGLNLSPTAMLFESVNGILNENYINLIENLIKHTNYHILLIPHVTFQKKYADYEVLRRLYKVFETTNRVTLIEDQDCYRLKGYISRCRFFITCRTHASIAAYSTCVPTLVLGYSIKARGIAKDLFGTEENFVLPVQNLKSKEDLINQFSWIMEHENMIRNKLENVMPDYIKKAYESRTIIEELIH